VQSADQVTRLLLFHFLLDKNIPNRQNLLFLVLAVFKSLRFEISRIVPDSAILVAAGLLLPTVEVLVQNNVYEISGIVSLD
jgi:hypothetical protein